MASRQRAFSYPTSATDQPRPPASTTSAAESHASVYAWILGAFLRALGTPAVRFCLWNGDVVYEGTQEPVGTITFCDRATLLRFVYHPELAFGEAYSDGRLTVDGDMVAVIEAAYRVPIDGAVARLLRRSPRPHANSLSGSRSNIHSHYDLGNDFYRLWLDERMLYTCAYYATPDMTLEQAQVAKMDHVCRKVGLRAGDRVIEAGCGWGALALHMARAYGARVRAFNISHEQISFAREQAAQAGLADRVEFIEDDYRNISGEYDVFMSVGMLEHVGHDHYRELGSIIDRCLAAHGRGLLHTIGRHRPARLNAFVEKHIFPGGYPPTLREMMDILEPYDFAVLDVENLRLHYAKTAREWLARFERHKDQVGRMFDQRFVRAWRVYLAGTHVAFNVSLLQLFQVVFSRARDNTIPLTRASVYADR